MNRDLARQSFERWYNAEYIRPIIPADRTEGGYQHPDAQAAWDAWQAALSHAEGEVVERPLGAAHNGRVFADRVEQEYGFECQGGPISGCYEWNELRRCLDTMAEYIERGSAPAGLTETAIKSSPAYRALHREKEHLLGLLKDQVPQVAVPEGWKLVPVEPTDDMIWAGAEASRVYRVDIMRSYDAMLAAAPTAPTGDTGLPLVKVPPEDRYTAEELIDAPEQPVSDPDGLDRVLMPRALTAKNGAKEALMGEFDFSVTMTCPECHPDDPNPDCEVCAGSVEYEQPHTVPWTTIKRIYTAAVDLLAAPAPDEREIAALREDAERYRFWREVLTGDDTAAMDLFEEELNRDVASGNRPPTGEELDKAVDVARRLRAGKEGE